MISVTPVEPIGCFSAAPPPSQVSEPPPLRLPAVKYFLHRQGGDVSPPRDSVGPPWCVPLPDTIQRLGLLGKRRHPLLCDPFPKRAWLFFFFPRNPPTNCPVSLDLRDGRLPREGLLSVLLSLSDTEVLGYPATICVFLNFQTVTRLVLVAFLPGKRSVLDAVLSMIPPWVLFFRSR